MTTLTYTTEHGMTLAGTEQGAWMDDNDPTTDLADQTASAKPMAQFGTLAKTAVNIGSGEFQYSGFSAANYLHRAYDVDFDLDGTGHTLMAWVNVGAVTTTETIIDRQDTGGTGASYRLVLESNRTFSSIVDDGTDSHTVTSVVPPAEGPTAVEGWTFVVATWDGVDTQRIYINGVLDTELGGGGAVGSLINGTAVLRIGLRATGADPCTQGLSIAKILTTPITAVEVLNIYNNEAGLFEPYSTYVFSGELLPITFPAQVINRSSTAIRKTADSIGGNRQVIFNREDTMWDITTSEVEAPLAITLEYFMSVAMRGEAFTIDLYDLGTIKECIMLNDSFATSRIATSEYFTIGFKVREL